MWQGFTVLRDNVARVIFVDFVVNIYEFQHFSTPVSSHVRLALALVLGCSLQLHP